MPPRPQDCLAVCRQCSTGARPFPMPFGSVAARDAWMVKHATATGHQLAAVHGWPSPQHAWRLAMAQWGETIPSPDDSQRVQERWD